MSAFDRLHPTIQEAIWKLQWESLRPLQVETIQAVFDGDEHLILSAATASGKTEAAFLPILSKIAEQPEMSVQALYISPLKALINDQFGRLENLCAQAQIPVHRWHGDVAATEKRRLREAPSGVLLITPESLESQFINYGRVVPRLYRSLQFVVIDELHSFLEDVRGMHLRSLLSRLKHSSGATPRLVGLSATLGDFHPAKRFLSYDEPSRVRLIVDGGPGKEVRVMARAYERLAGRDQAIEANSSLGMRELPAEEDLAKEIAQRFREGTDLVFCNSRSMAEELTDHLKEIAKEWQPGKERFLIHHGSLSKQIREEAEAGLKGNQAVTVLCTRTLEMGIDIGAVRAVGQVGAPWSVSSLMQRLGRSGRREGEAQVLRLYAIDEEATAASDVVEQLYPDLLRAVAMIELLRRKWVETPDFDRHHYSTCIHQIMSVLCQTGGALASDLFAVLCEEGAFRRIDKKRFAELLKGLSEKGLVQQMQTGEIILAPGGEKIVEARDFYAAFISQKEYSIEHAGEKIALLAADLIPPVGENMILAGRRWVVTYIDHEALRALVEPSKKRRVPPFLGRGGDMAAEVMREMHQALRSDEVPPYLHATGSRALGLARQAYRRNGLDSNAVIHAGVDTLWLPWAGTKIHRTLMVIARADGLDASLLRNGLGLGYSKVSREAFLKHLRKGEAGAFPSEQLAAELEDVTGDRFDEFVPEPLYLEAAAARYLDVEGARRVTREYLGTV